MLQQIVQQIAGTNPSLMDAIRNNQNEFLQLLNAAPTNAAPTNAAPLDNEQAAVGGEQASGGAGAYGSNVVSISVSEDDRNAIQRVCVF